MNAEINKSKKENLWTEIYRPTNIENFYGNKMKVQKAQNWIDNFDKTDKKILLLSGPSGIGKTTLAHILLKSKNYKPIEFNSSDIRGSKCIKETITKIVSYKNILSVFNPDIKPNNAIIMDEIDTLCQGGSDKGGMTEFINLIKELYKNVNEFKTPIICTFNPFSDKKLAELKKYSLEITLDPPTKYEYNSIFNNIADKEGILIKEKCKQFLINHAKGDMRRLINMLQEISKIYGLNESNESNGKKEIGEKETKYIIEYFAEKDEDIKLFETTKKIFEKKQTLETLNNFHSNNKLVIANMLYDNFFQVLKEKQIKGTPKNDDVAKNIYINTYKNIYKSLLFYDLHQTQIYNKQKFQSADISGLKLLSEFNNIYSALPSKNEYYTLKFTTYSNKVNQHNFNNKTINNLSIKLGTSLSFDDMYFICDLLIKYIYKIKDYNKAIKILIENNLIIDDLEPLFKINKYGNEEKSKLSITKTLKKELLIIYNEQYLEKYGQIYEE